jgi:hypothetical protein
MVAVCRREVSTAAPRNHNLAGVLVTQHLDAGHKMSLTLAETTSEVRTASILA